VSPVSVALHHRAYNVSESDGITSHRMPPFASMGCSDSKADEAIADAPPAAEQHEKQTAEDENGQSY